jgi:hypothetical protein
VSSSQLETLAPSRGGRELLLAEVASVAELVDVVASAGWSKQVTSRGGHGLLLAWASEAPAFDEIAALARTLISAGLYYFGAWGPGSDRVEYAVDVVDVSLAVDAKAPADAPIVMTTSFPAAPVADALHELWELAPRDEGKAAGPARVVVVLASPGVAAEVRAYFAR